MHIRHARALRLSRRSVNQKRKEFAYVLEKYENIRERHNHLVACGCVGIFEQVQAANAAVLQFTEDYLEVLAAGVLIERMLEKA